MRRCGVCRGRGGADSRDADGRYNVGVQRRRECRMTARVWLGDSIRVMPRVSEHGMRVEAEKKEQIRPGASGSEILVHLAVLSRVPTQMPVEVQTDHRTHGTQLGSDLALCLLNTMKENKTSVPGGGRQDLSWRPSS